MGYHNHYNDVGFARGKISPAKAVARIRAMGEKALAAAKAEVKKGADVVVADAKSRCPVKTGRLRDSIRAVSNKDGTVYWIVADASVKSQKSPTGEFYYGANVEFSPTNGKPFMYPALDAHRKEIEDNIESAIDKAAKGA